MIRSRLGALLLCSLALTLTGCPARNKIKPTQTRTQVKRSPQDLYNDALSSHRSGKTGYKAALRLYSQALERKPDLLQAHFNMGSIYEEMGRYQEAERHYGAVLRARNDHPDALYQMSQIYVRLKQYDRALNLFQQLLNKHKTAQKNPVLLTNLAALQLENKDYNGAVRTARKLLTLDSKSVVAYRLIARSNLLQRKYQVVHTVYNLAPKKKRDTDGPLFNIRGLAFLGEKKEPEAMVMFKKAVENAPGLFEAQLNLGILTLKYKDYSRALPALQSATKLRPTHRIANLAYAQALQSVKQYKKAEDVYKNRLLKQNKQDPDALLGLGVLYVRYMRKAEAGRDTIRQYIGEKGDSITKKHISYTMLTEAKNLIAEKEAMKKDESNKPKPRASKPKK